MPVTFLFFSVVFCFDNISDAMKRLTYPLNNTQASCQLIYFVEVHLKYYTSQQPINTSLCASFG